MARSSSIHYIAPSSISIVPNANGSASDLAVFVARGTAVRVYEPRIAGLGMEGDTYRQWTLSGRNRRLAEDGEYRIYARLSKTDDTAYLVFSKNDYVLTPNVSKTPIRAKGDDGKYYDWPALSDEQYQKRGYWWVSLGTVSASEGGVRTVSLDTGILGTDRYNEEYSLSPDAMPLRVELGCTVDDEDAGPTPYVPLGKSAVLTAVLLEGWSSTSVERFDHWEITRYTEDAIADDAWNHPDGDGSHRGMDGGSIRLVHSREAVADDFNGAVAAVFTVSAWGRPDGSPEPSGGQETDDTPDVDDVPVDAGDVGEGGQEGGGGEQEGEGQDVPELVVIASASITMYPETSERFEIVPSTGVVSYNSSSDEYIPADGVTVRVRATDQRGDTSDLTYGQFSSMGLSLEYASEEGAWTQMSVGGATSAVVTAVVPSAAFSEKRGVSVRLVRNDQDGGYARELARTVIDFVQDATDTKEREWIFLRSKTDILFGDVGSAFPEPYLIGKGEKSPEGEASDKVPYDDQLDGWVPQGWWDEEQGVSDTWCYEYASYRDYVSEEDGGHWGPFTKARTWHHFAGLISGDEISDVIDEQVGGKYISKQVNDAAAGVITFLKGIKIGLQRLFGWDEDGNITARNVTADTFNVEKFTAHQSLMNEIYSDNFNWDYGMNGTGFILTKFGPNNHAFLALDDLVVRGKMTVNTLEIREETYTGGNQHWSPAGSVIFRVDFIGLDENNKEYKMGMSEVSTPWLLNGQPFLTIEKNLLPTIAYATRKQIQETLGSEISNVYKFRCYIVADNGTTATRNFWCVGDQARCQTYNIVSRDKRDGEGAYEPGAIQTIDPLANVPVDQKDGAKTMENVYYWRLVLKVGTEKLEDGKSYNYIDLANQHAKDEHGNIVNKTFVDGSDIPAAGDTIIQFGNDRNIDRMGIISHETYNGAGETGQTPAIKMYGGVNDFTVNGKRTAMMSPSLWEINTNIFRLVTHDGSVTPIINDRGKWDPDERYHYADQVVHNGGIWLCIIDQDYYWVDGWEDGGDDSNKWLHYDSKDPRTHLYKDGLLNEGESGFEFSKGHLVGNSNYLLRLISTFTQTEPSDQVELIWAWKGEAEAGPRGDFKSRVFIRSAITPLTPANDTPQGEPPYNTYDYPIPHPMTHVVEGQTITETWSDGVPNSDFQLWSSVCTFHGDGTKTDWSDPAPESDSQTQDIEFSAAEQLTEQNSPPYGNDATQKDSNTYKQQRHSQGWYDPNDTLPQDVTWEDMVWRAERQIKNDVYVGGWVISRVKGEKGDPGELDEQTIRRIENDVAQLVKAGLTLIIDPQVIIVNQDSESGKSSTGTVFSGAKSVNVTILRNGVKQVIGYSNDYTRLNYDKASNLEQFGDTTKAKGVLSNDSKTLTISLEGISTAKNSTTGRYEFVDDSGTIQFRITVENVDYNLTVKWFLNRLGGREEVLRGDIKTEYMSRTEYSTSEELNNLLRGTKNPAIGTSTPNNNYWGNDSSTSLTIQTVSDSPVDEYTSAFRIATSDKYFSQTQNFWKKTDTYKFSAYVRRISGTTNTKAIVKVEQGNSTRFTQEISTETFWTYVSFYITIPEYAEAYNEYDQLTSTALFKMGITGTGTVEILAPILMCTYNASVIRTDYEGQIQTRADGLDTKFTAITSDLDGRIGANTSDISTLSQTAKGLISRVVSVEGDISKIGDDLDNLEDVVQKQGGSISTIQQTSDRIYMGITTGWKKNYVVNPLATDGRVNIVTSSERKSDNEFGQIVELANNGGNWQLNSVIDSSYGELTGKTVTWFCIVKAIERRNVSPYNCKLHFGTGANETIRNLHAIVMTATYISYGTPMTIEAVSNLNTSYYKDISYGQQKIGENGWYICWVSATPRNSSTTIIDGSDIYACGFNSMEGKWQIYYGGVVLGNGCPSVDVIRESGNLKRTGIDIESGKVDIQADNFIVRNNEGEQTLGTDADGDFEVSGTIKANNLYRTVAICISSESINILEAGGSTKRCIYIKSLNLSPNSEELAEEYNFGIGDYFFLTPAMISSGAFDDSIFQGDFVVCTGNADIVLPMDNYNANYLENRNMWQDGTWVRLPEASHVPGKVVEIRHHLTQGTGSITISTVEQTAYAIVFAPMIDDDMQVRYNRGSDPGASAYYTWPAKTIIKLYSNGSNWISLGSIRNVNT